MGVLGIPAFSKQSNLGDYARISLWWVMHTLWSPTALSSSHFFHRPTSNPGYDHLAPKHASEHHTLVPEYGYHAGPVSVPVLVHLWLRSGSRPRLHPVLGATPSPCSRGHAVTLFSGPRPRNGFGLRLDMRRGCGQGLQQGGASSGTCPIPESSRACPIPSPVGPMHEYHPP